MEVKLKVLQIQISASSSMMAVNQDHSFEHQ